MKKMDNSVKITLIVVATILILALLVSYGISSMNAPKINTQGLATITVMPDIVVTYFQVISDASTADEAKNLNNAALDTVIDKLIAVGLEREDIKTQNFNVNPRYSWSSGTQRLLGYRATHSLKIEISTEDKDLIGKVIDAGISGGASLSYINYELTQESQNKYKTEALAKATEDAKIKAEAIAQGLGKKLGKLVSVSSSDFGYYPWRLYATSGDMEETTIKAEIPEIEPTDQEINARISVVYSIS
jgi:uncharacterized protein YggE